MKTSLKSNIIFNSLYQILALVIPFITAPYLARTIGVGGVGIYSFSQSIAIYFTYITLLGLQNYGNRTIAAVQDNINERSKLFFEIFSMQLIMFAISILLYFFYIICFSVDKIAAIIMMIWVLSAAFDINWFFFGMEKFKMTVIRNCIVKLLTVICIFVFVKKANDIYIYIAIMSIGTFLSQLCLWPYLKKYLRFIKPTKQGIYQHFKPNLTLFIPVIAASVYNLMDKIMLGYMSSMDEVGYYENAEKVIKMIQSLIVAVGTVMLPRMTALFEKKVNQESEKYFSISMEAVLIYVSAAIFGILGVKDTFTNLYFGAGYEKTALLLGILIITVFFFGTGNVLRTQYLIPKKKDKIFVNSAILGAVLNLIANIILIPCFSSIGAALATVLAESSVCCYQFYMVKNELNLKQFFLPTVIYFSIGLVMFIVIKHIPTNNYTWFVVFLQILIGSLVFLPLAFCYLFLKTNKKSHKMYKRK